MLIFYRFTHTALQPALSPSMDVHVDLYTRSVNILQFENIIFFLKLKIVIFAKIKCMLCRYIPFSVSANIQATGTNNNR